MKGRLPWQPEDLEFEWYESYDGILTMHVHMTCESGANYSIDYVDEENRSGWSWVCRKVRRRR